MTNTQKSAPPPSSILSHKPLNHDSTTKSLSPQPPSSIDTRFMPTSVTNGTISPLITSGSTSSTEQNGTDAPLLSTTPPYNNRSSDSTAAPVQNIVGHTTTVAEDMYSNTATLTEEVHRTSDASSLTNTSKGDDRDAEAEDDTVAPTQAPIPTYEFIPINPDQERAIAEYRHKVNRSRLFHRAFTQKNCPPVSVQPVQYCLKHTTSSMLPLVYPKDAHEHFNEIRMALAPWAQHGYHQMHSAAGYSGPWIENYWITHFESLYDDNTAVAGPSPDDNEGPHNKSATQSSTSQHCLSDLFGPYIPIFLPWVDHCVHGKGKYPDGLVQTLRSVLRPDVPYISVSQSDEGLMREQREFDHERYVPNLVVLSAGGFGHVPIPLFKQTEERSHWIPVHNRTIGISYVGSLENAPHNMREQMHDAIQRLLPAYSTTAQDTSASETSATANSTATIQNFTYHYYYGDDWRNVSANSRFSLVPRGYGRTAYHLMEILQMGLIPIHVHLDIPWVPYADLYEEIGYTSHVNDLATLLEHLATMSHDDIVAMESRIVNLVQSHFAVSGALAQIEKFMKQEPGWNNASDLRCQALPTSMRGERL